MRRCIPFSLLLVLTSCRGAVPDTGAVRPVKAITVSRLVSLERDFAGLATPDDAVNLAFKVSGQLLDIPVSQGDSVAEGALVAELDPREIQLQASSDKAIYEQSRSHLERMRALLEHEAVSRQAFESAQAAYAQAQSVYENTLDLLNQTRLRAPFAGVVEKKFADNYERVQSGQTIVRLVNPQTETVRFTLPESALALISRPDTRFGVVFDNYPGMRFDARLKDYAKTSSDALGFPVSLTVANPDPQRYPISPGMSCSVSMQLVDTLSRAVWLPLTAIYAPAAGGEYVWVIDSADRVRMHPVVLGELFGRDRVEVEQGLEPGQRVVTAGTYRLSDGQRVVVLP